MVSQPVRPGAGVALLARSVANMRRFGLRLGFRARASAVVVPLWRELDRPIAFAAAGAALLGVGILAAFVPAWRAVMTAPVIALREQ